MANARTQFDALAGLLQQHEAVAGRVAAAQALLWEDEAFLIQHRDAIALRLAGGTLRDTLKLEGVRGFDPMRPDSEDAAKPGWVRVPSAHFLAWERLALEALHWARQATLQNVSWMPAPEPAAALAAPPPSSPEALAERAAKSARAGFSFSLKDGD